MFLSPRRGFAEESLRQRAPGERNANQDSEPGDGHHPWKCAPCSYQNLEFRNKPTESRQADRRHSGERECNGGERNKVRQPHRTERVQVARVRPVVDHAPHHREQQPRNHSVRKHLQHGAIEPNLRQRHQSEQNKTHMRNAGIADDKLEVALHQRHAGPVNNADERQQREDLPPRSQPQNAESPRIETGRKEHHGDAQTAISAKLHHHAGQQHRGGRGRGRVACRRPGVERPHAGQYRESHEYQREKSHLKVCRKVISGERLEAHARPAGNRPRRHHPRQDKSTARERIESQLHRRIFALAANLRARAVAGRRSPDRDQKILRNNRDLIKHKQQKQIEAEKHAVHAADQHQIKREEILRALLDVPGKENPRRRRNAGQQDQREADAVRGQIVGNTQLRNPRHPCDRDQLPRPPVQQRNQAERQPSQRADQSNSTRKVLRRAKPRSQSADER